MAPAYPRALVTECDIGMQGTQWVLDRTTKPGPVRAGRVARLRSEVRADVQRPMSIDDALATAYGSRPIPGALRTAYEESLKMRYDSTPL